MALTAITKFFNFKPHLSNRFTCCLYVGGAAVKEYLQFAVQSVQFTELESNASDAAVYFGNGYVTVPIINTASRKLNITFEETNTMEVSYILDSIMASHFHGVPRVVAIGIREYDDRFINIHSSKLYYCLLSGWDEPQFSRSGNPGVVTVSATFNVMSEEIWNGSAPTKESLGYVKIETLKDTDKHAEAIAESFQSSGKSRKQFAKQAAENSTIKMGTNAGKMTEAEKKQMAESIAKERAGSMKSGSSAGENNANAILKQAAKTSNPEAFLRNAAALQTQLGSAQQDLKAAGITFSINCYAGNQEDHASTSKDGNATHDSGAKADIEFKRADDTKITGANATVEEMNMINEILSKNGLVMQLETSGKETSGWGDVALQQFYGMGSGNARNDNQFSRGGSGVVYNTSSGKYDKLKK